MLGLTQVAKNLPFDDSQVLMGIRGLYLLSNLIITGIYLYLRMKINYNKDMTTIKYVEPAPRGLAKEPKLITITIHAYDMDKLHEIRKGQLFGVVIMGVIHFYFKDTGLLLIQSVISLKSVLEANLVKIHVFRQPAVGDLKRPWKVAGGIMSWGLNPIVEPKVDEGSATNVEKAKSEKAICRKAGMGVAWGWMTVSIQRNEASKSCAVIVDGHFSSRTIKTEAEDTVISLT